MHVHRLASFWCRQYPQLMETVMIALPNSINPPGFSNSLSLTRNCFPSLGNYLFSCMQITKEHILTLSTWSLRNYIPHLFYSLSIAFKLGLLDQMHLT